MKIDEYTLDIPIIQGGMGVGVSLSQLAGHVAKYGAMGIISTAQIGFQEPDFETNTKNANLRAIDYHIKKAKEIAQGKGMIGVNVMCALRDYQAHVKQAVLSGADCIISGAGLPKKLPELVNDRVKIAPIVSSSKAAQLILKLWDRHYQRIADFIVIEGSLAGGHLGFKKDDLINHTTEKLEDILQGVKQVVKKFEEKYHHKIPIFVAGGIYTREDIHYFMKLGADGVQMGTRFIATHECDASLTYKQHFINSQQEDIQLIHSPVGMPGRAIQTKYMKQDHSIKKCYGCIQNCSMKSAPYCITDALIRAVKGQDGLVFSGINGYRIKEIVNVKDLLEELTGEVL